MSETTKIKKCTCSHDFQDNLYGKGYRLMNLKTKETTATYVCTVCLKQHKFN